MNIAGYAIRHQAVTLVFMLMVIVGGVFSYLKLGRLEDPQFSIKTAVISTRYPGATAEEVEQEVTERLETAVQNLKQLDEVRSISRAGVSIIYADMKDMYDKDTLPQVWDELRRKVGAAAADLPPGCHSPAINDDFGDVYGIFFAITGDGYSHHDLRKFADDLRRELLLCDQVGRVEFWGIQTEVVYIEIERTKLAQLGLPPQAIFAAIDQQNAVTDAGDVRVQDETMRLRVTGETTTVEALGEILVSGGEDRMIRVKDVARIERGYLDPPMQMLFHNGKKAIGLGVSCIQGGNVVVMGDAVKEKLAELESRIPVGIEIDPIAFQADTVREAVNGFVINLAEAVLIVVLLLVVFMGLREGFIIGGILLVTILATFIGMYVLEVNLQRISLGALIIALGMLVDNAIVVAEGIVVKSHEGLNRTQAAEEAVAETQWPLLGATFIAILAFAAISISRDVTGEFLGSLFTVIALSLGLSWVFAVTICPYLCVRFLPHEEEGDYHPHDHGLYVHYRKLLQICIGHKALTLLIVAGLFGLATQGFHHIPKNFFPDSTRPQFRVDVWLPEGTHIEHTQETLDRMGKYVSSLEGVTKINTFIGSGAMRFMLTYSPESMNSNYGQLLIDVDDYRRIVPTLIPTIQKQLEADYPAATIQAKAFAFGPPGGGVEVRFSGSEIAALRDIANQAVAIMRREPNVRALRNDWGERVKIAAVDLAESQARNIGVTRIEIGNSLQMTFDGSVAGLYRDGDDLLPIVLRPPEHQRKGIGNLKNVQVWSSSISQTLPIDQVSDGVLTRWEDPVIHRRNRMRTVTVSCDPRTGTADSLFKKLRGRIESLSIPDGYKLEWGGQYERSIEANQKLMSKVPLAFTLMFFITVMLFNTLRHPVIIFLGLPMAVIGVSAGLLVAQEPFNFVATLGFLSLAGMLIKNEIVLLEQVNLDLKAGKEPYTAVIDSAVSRVRPVSMAAFTTVLGMIPLLWDAFFVSLAVTIMAGLTFATVLTLVVLPVLYSIAFGVRRPEKGQAS
jgi:multidrug efflux pump subunit AcrB